MMKDKVDQCLYSLRATAEDCSEAGEPDRAALLRACEATISEALNSRDAKIERLSDALVELTRLDPPETECANVRVVVYGNDARNFALRALTPNAEVSG